MSFKTIAGIAIDDAAPATALVHLGAQAFAWDGHADLLCLGVDRSQIGMYHSGANAMILQEAIQRAQADAETVKAELDTSLANSGARYSIHTGVAQVIDLSRAVKHWVRFADLVILPKPYGPGRDTISEALVEASMLQGNAPVLIVPDDCAPVTHPKTVVLAWNESDQALKAARHALPFLQRAEKVRIVVIDPDPHSPERSDPGGNLAQMLARHNVNCEIDVLSRSLPRTSDILARHVTDTGADMLVMGAYGHSRLREALIGGASRDILESAQVPVLMAH
jgi:nucleotide-binding universal stress UspA family protein